MIQGQITKPIETKAAAKAEVVANKKMAKGQGEVDGSIEQEFANELEKIVSGEGESELVVKPVQVSFEQILEKPSTLVSPTGSVETTTPKIFDPEITKDVEQLNHPLTTDSVPVTPNNISGITSLHSPSQLTNPQALELANTEVAAPKEVKNEVVQAMLKTPQVSESAARAPAIDFAKAEVDPQLLNNEDFVLQKNIATKKSLPNAYGMKVVPQQQEVALEAGLKDTQVVKEASSIEGSGVKSQQFILNMMNEQKAPQMNETQGTPKVFDMNQVKTSEPDKIISQITDYIVQSKTASEPTVNMRVNHEQLGMLDITVSKSGVAHENIAINIGTHTADGKNFFQQNSEDLLPHMTSAGLNVTDMKIETPSQTAKNDFDFGSQSGRNQHGSEKQFGSESNQRRHDQERRQDLWKLLNQEAA